MCHAHRRRLLAPPRTGKTGLLQRIANGITASQPNAYYESDRLLAEYAEFRFGDACNLKPQFSGYDLVLAANLIDRLYRPRRFLDSIHERINDGGLLIIASPYTWLEEHTPKEEWIG